jgi:hypothetical protein
MWLCAGARTRRWMMGRTTWGRSAVRFDNRLHWDRRVWGLVLRFLSFVFMLVLVVAGVVLGDFEHGGWGGTLVHLAIAIVCLQVGYVAGIGIRALALRLARRGTPERCENRYSRLIIGPRPW